MFNILTRSVPVGPLYSHATSWSSLAQRASFTIKADLVLPSVIMQWSSASKSLFLLTPFIVSISNGTTKISLFTAIIACLPSCETRNAFKDEADGKLTTLSKPSVSILTDFTVKPLMNISVSPSGSHCRSFLAPPSFVSWLSSEPSRFAIQMSLFATKAILSAPPPTGMEGVGVSVAVSVGGTTVSVLVDSIATGTTVVSLTEDSVSVARGAEVAVLIDACVADGVLVPLNRKNPPARAATTTTGTMTNNTLNALLGGSAFASALTVGADGGVLLARTGAACNLVVMLRATSRKAFVISTALEKRSFLFFAIAFWMIISMPSGSFGFVCRIWGTGSVMCLMATAIGVSAS